MLFMKHLKIIVRGRVQGVGFRYNTIQTAKKIILQAMFQTVLTDQF